MKIHAPNPNYTGTDRYGTTVVLDFRDGVADYDDDLPAGVKAYLHSAGYGLGSKPKAATEVLEVPVVVPDTDAQEAKESELAQRTRIDSEPVPDVVAELGRQLDAGEPKGGAKREEWVEFARSQGAPETELGELGTEGALSRDDLRAKYGS